MQVTSRSQPGRTTNPARLALVAFLGAESVFFGTLLMAYLYLRAGALDAVWAAQSRDLLLPFANTAVLLLSALAAAQAVRAIRRDRVPALQMWLLAALLLGLVFVAGQFAEFTRSGMRPDDEGVGGVFFTLLGFHALHVLAGVLILALNLGRARLGDFNARSHAAVELGAWFWYYVAAVWLVLFAALYLL